LYKPQITDYRNGGIITDGEKPAPVSLCAHKSNMDYLGIEPSLPK
jgi:hypothetical protein